MHSTMTPSFAYVLTFVRSERPSCGTHFSRTSTLWSTEKDRSSSGKNRGVSDCNDMTLSAHLINLLTSSGNSRALMPPLIVIIRCWAGRCIRLAAPLSPYIDSWRAIRPTAKMTGSLIARTGSSRASLMDLTAWSLNQSAVSGGNTLRFIRSPDAKSSRTLNRAGSARACWVMNRSHLSPSSLLICRESQPRGANTVITKVLCQ